MTPKALGWTFLASAAAVAVAGVFAGRRARMDRMGGLGSRAVSTPRLARYFDLERKAQAIEEKHYKYRDKHADWPPMTDAIPVVAEMARLRAKMTPAERCVLEQRDQPGDWSTYAGDWQPCSGPFFDPGDRAFFEYHCFESDDSTDAELWYHSCQHCTVLGAEGRDEELLHGPLYKVRFDDGFEATVNTDELFRRRFKVSEFRADNRDDRWHPGEGCRPADTAKALAYRAKSGGKQTRLGGLGSTYPATREALDEMCQGLDYHLVQGDPGDFYHNRYGYHWTSEANLPGIKKHGLGSHPPHWAEEHEIPYLYCMGTGESAAYVEQLLKDATPPGVEWPREVSFNEFQSAVEKALQKFYPDWHRVWFAFEPEGSRDWGDAQVRIDFEKLGDWIADQNIEAFMYPDDAYGYGLFMPKRIPRKFLSIRTGKRAGMAGLGSYEQPTKEIDEVTRKKIRNLLVWLRRQPFAEHVLVVGSVARGSATPGDVDIVVDMEKIPREQWRQVDRSLLHVAGHPKWYGLFDPFLLMPGKRLLVRNDYGTDWERAKVKRTALLANAVPIKQLKSPILPEEGGFAGRSKLLSPVAAPLEEEEVEDKLAEDPYSRTWQTSLRYTGSVRYHGRIPPAALRLPDPA